MASKQNEKPLCKFGEKCYRKNQQHLQQYRHPKRKADEDEDLEPAKKAKNTKRNAEKKIEDFFSKKRNEHDLSDDEEISESGKESEDKGVVEQESDSATSDGSDEETEQPASPDDIRKNIANKFLVDMPEDFYDFWNFCKEEHSSNPADALKSSLGFQLVGPFDILAGKHKHVKKNQHGKRPNYLLHWRYYFDPPEFQTVIKGDDSTQFHLGYFRDDPKETPVFVGANSAANNCSITQKGDNLFAAISICITEKLKDKGTSASSKAGLTKLQERLKEFVKDKDYNLDVKSKRMKERDKKVVCKSFHGAGIVVPVDENEVGYREVPETVGDLKKMFKKIADSKNEAERDKNFEPLQELITLVQFANDECDYGEGLELGMDLFCYGSEVFHSTLRQLLPLAYMLLGRSEFETIILQHLKHRRKGSNLSQLE